MTQQPDQQALLSAMAQQQIENLNATIAALQTQLSEAINLRTQALAGNTVKANQIVQLQTEVDELKQNVAKQTAMFESTKERYNHATDKFAALKWFAQEILNETGQNFQLSDSAVQDILRTHQEILNGEVARENVNRVAEILAQESLAKNQKGDVGIPDTAEEKTVKEDKPEQKAPDVEIVELETSLAKPKVEVEVEEVELTPNKLSKPVAQEKKKA